MACDRSRAIEGRLALTEQGELLARFRRGDVEVFQLLLRPHVGALQGLARRLVGDVHWAEDLVQETLVRAFRALGSFRGEVGVRAWLFRIMLRLGSEPARWQRREKLPAAPQIEIPDALGAGPQELAIERELRDRLQEALERLTARQRAALHLRAAEGMDYQAIAAALECKSGAARMLVLEARRKVLERLERFLDP